MKKEINLPLNILIWILACLWIFPVFWIVLTAFRKEPGQFVSYIFPKGYTLANFKYLFKYNPDFPFVKWLGNTLVVSVFSCLLNTFITISMSYVMSRLRFKLRKTYLKIGLVLNMFPGFMSMIAIYFILKAINMTQTLTGLVFVYLDYS